MDYTKVPRALIYKDRDDLKDFGVQTPGTMNNLLFKRLKQNVLMSVSGAREVALRCYNNAYYVCTLILLESKDFPELRISDYVDKILEIEKDKKYTDEVCLASMAMASLLLAAYDEEKYGGESDIWENIYHRCTHFQWYNSSATAIFHHMMSGEYRITTPLTSTLFAPRDIVEAIEEVGKNKPYLLEHCVEYICERLACTDDSQRRMYGADLAIARLNELIQHTYKDWGYDPKTDSFEPEELELFGIDDPIYEKSFWKAVNSIKKYIEYIKKNYPTKDVNDSQDSKEKAAESHQAPEVEELQATIKELESKLKEANNIKEQQTTRIKELEVEVEGLKEENATLKEQLAPFLEFASENGEDNLTCKEKFTLRERIVFFATVLSLEFDKKYTVFSNFATFISELCNDQKNISPFISKMKKPEEAAANAKAAKKVAGLLKKILPQQYKNDEHRTINKIINSMTLNFPDDEDE